MQPETNAPAVPAGLAPTAFAMDDFIVTPYSYMPVRVFGIHEYGTAAMGKMQGVSPDG